MKRGITSLLIGLTALMLTPKGGVFNNPETGYTEKYYNLSMKRVVKRAQDMGIPCETTQLAGKESIISDLPFRPSISFLPVFINPPLRTLTLFSIESSP